jgi:hypothetical protein
MSNLSTILGGSSDVDPRKEGLPLFGLWADDGQNQHANFRIYNSSYSNVGAPWGAAANSTTSYRFGMLADPVHAYNMGDFGSTLSQGSLSSGGYSEWQQYGHSSTYMVDQYPDTPYYSVSKTGHISWNSKHQYTSQFEWSAGWTKVNMVLPEGVRPRRTFCNRSTSMREVQGTVATVQLDGYNYASHMLYTGQGSFAVGTGYNEKTKTLVMIHSSNETSGTGHSVHIFKSSKDLNSVTRIKEFFDNLTSTEYFQGTWVVSNNKDNVVVVGNNGYVGIGAKYGVSMRYGVFDCNVLGSGYTTTASRQAVAWRAFQGSTTTSWGADNGVGYYTRFQTTWDGTWGMIQTPYYYAGQGLCAFVINLENPRKVVDLGQTRTSYSNPYVPIGRTGFMGGASDNTDSETWQTYSFAMDPTDSSHTGTTEVFYGASNGSTLVPNNTANRSWVLSNGSAQTLTIGYTGLTGGYYSTCYPLLTNVNWWGAYGSADSSYGGK